MFKFIKSKAKNNQYIPLFICSSIIGLYLLTSLTLGGQNFDSNCRSDLPKNYCTTGNIFGWLSSSVWISSLLSQLLKNINTECKGLSVLWSLCNFFASTLNTFAIFCWRLPAFSRMSSLSMCILNGLILLQIFYFRRDNKQYESNNNNTAFRLVKDIDEAFEVVDDDDDNNDGIEHKTKYF